MQLRALSIDAALPLLLRASPRARVHSVFERVVNVDLDGARLLSLAQRDADDAPDSVVVDVASWSAFDLARGTAVRVGRNSIDLGDRISIALENARPWQARLPPYPLDGATLSTNLPLAREYLDEQGDGGGMRRTSASAPAVVDQAMQWALRSHAEGLCRALASNDAALARAHVERLVGLGPGLTPSGDDFLLGLLAALNIPGSPAQAMRRIGAQVAKRAAARTHLISAAALKHAADGRVRAGIIYLCDALMHAPATKMLQALAAVLRIGSSSGYEIASGVLAGFQLHLNREPAQRIAAADRAVTGALHGA